MLRLQKGITDYLCLGLKIAVIDLERASKKQALYISTRPRLILTVWEEITSPKAKTFA